MAYFISYVKIIVSNWINGKSIDFINGDKYIRDTTQEGMHHIMESKNTRETTVLWKPMLLSGPFSYWRKLWWKLLKVFSWKLSVKVGMLLIGTCMLGVMFEMLCIDLSGVGGISGLFESDGSISVNMSSCWLLKSESKSEL